MSESVSISFFVQGVPKGQPRARACKRGKHAGVYDPGTANDWKLQVQICGKAFIPATPLQGPLRVDLTFYFPRPKGHYRSGKHSHELRPDAPTYHISKPDRDNSDKAVMDQMTTMRFWEDDSQACDGRIQKLYANEAPGCQITVTQITPGQLFKTL